MQQVLLVHYSSPNGQPQAIASWGPLGTNPPGVVTFSESLVPEPRLSLRVDLPPLHLRMTSRNVSAPSRPTPCCTIPRGRKRKRDLGNGLDRPFARGIAICGSHSSMLASAGKEKRTAHPDPPKWKNSCAQRAPERLVSLVHASDRSPWTCISGA